jgi:hypothetical protein
MNEEYDENKYQKAFENLYGPLAEHMYFDYEPWEEGDTLAGQELKRRAILDIFQKRLRDLVLGFHDRQKAGEILSKEEIAAKREAKNAGYYIDSYLDSLRFISPIPSEIAERNV